MKKYFSMAGILVGVCMIVFGILAATGCLGDAKYYSESSPYNSGFASFGGDYYTYSVNNSAETTSAVRGVSGNLRAISDLLRLTLGLFLMGFGAAIVCGFGIVFSACRAEAAPEAESASVEMMENAEKETVDLEDNDDLAEQITSNEEKEV